MDDLFAEDEIKEVEEQEETVLTVSQLNRHARNLLEDAFGTIWVDGEISNLARPQSGHWYFSLKDEQAQIRCAMFRMNNRRCSFKPQDGAQVLIKGKVSLYENRGDFQLIVEKMEETGDGALRRQFEQLKKKLHDEGLFEWKFKKPLPLLPLNIGVITSPQGAALRDVISVLGRRFPAARIIVYPVQVQGSDAAAQIIQAIETATKRNEVDALIICRGGGSLEDLMAFNDENVARAAFACPLPIVAGVGHEIDFSILDFIADQRAATPSAAAELLTPHQDELLAQLIQIRHRFTNLVQQALHNYGNRLEQLSKRLQHPGQRLIFYAQRLDDLSIRLDHAMANGLEQCLHRYGRAQQGLLRHNPKHKLQQLAMNRHYLSQRLHRAMSTFIKETQQTLQRNAHNLHLISPLSILDRGFSITQTESGKIVRSAKDIPLGGVIKTKLGQGQLVSKVLKKSTS